MCRSLPSCRLVSTEVGVLKLISTIALEIFDFRRSGLQRFCSILSLPSEAEIICRVVGVSLALHDVRVLFRFSSARVVSH